MPNIINIGDKCTGCLSCYNSCYSKAITLVEDEYGFIKPQVHLENCIECGMCDKSCPEISNEFEKETKVLKSYYGWVSDEESRYKSTSGGLFTSFVNHTLNEEGVVYGAYFDYDTMTVKHASSDDIDWHDMRKSKYVQSYIGLIYRDVKEKLDSDRRVLFVGTPCQVSGLKSFLKKEYNKLVTCDFICHGVPSMKLLKQNIQYYYQNKDIKSYDFRSKRKGWTSATLKVVTGSKTKLKQFDEDIYYSAFMKYINLRPSCYDCNYSESTHQADVTIADFWGYRKHDASILDERGLSLLLVNNTKGTTFINKIVNGNTLTLELIDNVSSSYVFKQKGLKLKYKKKRDVYLANIKKLGYKKAAKQACLIIPLKAKILKKIVVVKNNIRGKK